MQINIKKLSEKAVMPVKAHTTDAGFDLTSSKLTTEIGEDGQLIIVFHTDLSFEIPEGYVGLVFPRSSIFKKSLYFTNSVGVIDSGYRGEILAKMKTNTNVIPAVYKEGERFAQLIILPYPEIEFNETETLSESDRDKDGYGSTGDEEVKSEETINTDSEKNEN
jgi:dUTP pyrophosphatase